MMNRRYLFLKQTIPMGLRICSAQEDDGTGFFEGVCDEVRDEKRGRCSEVIEDEK